VLLLKLLANLGLEGVEGEVVAYAYSEPLGLVPDLRVCPQDVEIFEEDSAVRAAPAIGILAWGAIFGRGEGPPGGLEAAG